MKKVVIDDIKMNYFCFGSGKKPMLIIPGISLISVMNYENAVADAYKLFADDFIVYVFDRREDISEPYNIEIMARDIAIAMKELDIRDAYLFGTSQGGMIAQTIAVEYPELVKKMVLGSSVSKVYSFAEEPQFENWIRLAEEKKVHELNMSFAEYVYSEEMFLSVKDTIASTDEMVTDDDLERFIIITKGMENYDIRDRLSEIKCPVLVIGSEKDKVFSISRIRDTAERLGCESYYYDGYGHVVYDEAPDYKERLFKFFKTSLV